MIGTLTFFGLNMPWLLVLTLISWVALLAARRVLAMTGFYQWVWHPALFDTALFLLMLLATSRLSNLFLSAP